ncbi:hypothetical protein V6N13_006017 [Hibiscus sabdariffa]
MVPKSFTPMTKDTGIYQSKDCSVETCVPDSFGMLGTKQCNRIWEYSVFVRHVYATRVEIEGVKKADLIDHMRIHHKVRSVSDIMLQEIYKPPLLLSYSNFLNWKRVILWEAEETLELGKLIGTKTIG